jgi:hypothetical protein
MDRLGRMWEMSVTPPPPGSVTGITMSLLLSDGMAGLFDAVGSATTGLEYAESVGVDVPDTIEEDTGANVIMAPAVSVFSSPSPSSTDEVFRFVGKIGDPVLEGSKHIVVLLCDAFSLSVTVVVVVGSSCLDAPAGLLEVVTMTVGGTVAVVVVWSAYSASSSVDAG